MNYTETFDQFATRVSPTDLALYAGLGLILWLLFKDRLSPIQTFISDFTTRVKQGIQNNNINSTTENMIVSKPQPKNTEDVFFKLVESWKRTRDLAVQSNCEEAVKVADQMFPYLSPQTCVAKKDSNNA